MKWNGGRKEMEKEKEKRREKREERRSTSCRLLLPSYLLYLPGGEGDCKQATDDLASRRRRAPVRRGRVKTFVGSS